MAPLQKEGIGNKTNFYSLEPVREVFNARRMAVSFHKSKNRENCRRNVFVRLKTLDSSGIPVKPIDWTGVCRLDQFDGLQRGWFRGHYARIGSMGRKHK